MQSVMQSFSLFISVTQAEIKEAFLGIPENLHTISLTSSHVSFSASQDNITKLQLRHCYQNVYL